MKNKTIKNMMSIALLTSMSAAMLVGCKKEESTTNQNIKNEIVESEKITINIPTNVDESKLVENSQLTEYAKENLSKEAYEELERQLEEKRKYILVETEEDKYKKEVYKDLDKIQKHDVQVDVNPVGNPPESVFAKNQNKEAANLIEKVHNKMDNASIHMKVETTAKIKSNGITNSCNADVYVDNDAIHVKGTKKDSVSEKERNFECYIENGIVYINKSGEWMKKDQNKEHYSYRTFYDIPKDLTLTDNAKVEFDNSTKTYVVTEDVGYLVSKYNVLYPILVSGDLESTPYEKSYYDYEDLCINNKAFFVNQKATMVFKEDGTPVSLTINIPNLNNLFKKIKVNVTYSDLGNTSITLPEDVLKAEEFVTPEIPHGDVANEPDKFPTENIPQLEEKHYEAHNTADIFNGILKKFKFNSMNTEIKDLSLSDKDNVRETIGLCDLDNVEEIKYINSANNDLSIFVIKVKDEKDAYVVMSNALIYTQNTNQDSDDIYGSYNNKYAMIVRIDDFDSQEMDSDDILTEFNKMDIK